MDRLTQDLHSCFGVGLASQFASKAIYHHALDFVEYVADDGFVLSERVDEYLTLLRNGETKELVGFRLKGFAYMYNHWIKPLFGEGVGDLLDLLPVFTFLVGRLGDDAFSDVIERRASAYKEAARFASIRQVKINASDLPMAA